MNFMEKMLSEQKKSDELEKARDREFFLKLGQLFCNDNGSKNYEK